MTQSRQRLKRFSAGVFVWVCRATLTVCFSIMTYVVSSPEYNYAHWVPRSTLHQLGFSYDHLLWLERNGDYFLHFGGALLITLLLSVSKLPWVRQAPWRPLLLTVLMCFGAEALQFVIGRGVQSSDLLLGILGSFMAYLCITKNKKHTPSTPTT